MIDKSNPLVEQVYELAPLLNGRLGPTITKIHRYMITLYVATHVPAFLTDAKEIENTNYFTLYRLGKVARALNDIKYDRSRVALKVYKKAEEKGWIGLKKEGGETYISITKKGDKLYSEILIDLITLKRLHSINPQIEDSILDRAYEKEFITKGTKFEGKYKTELKSIIDNLLSNILQVNNELGDQILFLKEDPAETY